MNAEDYDEDDDHGLPDAAFTEDELAAGVQHIMRTGNPDATSSGRRPAYEPLELADDLHDERTDENVHGVKSSPNSVSLRFETFAQASAWSRAHSGKVFRRAANGNGYEPKEALFVPREIGAHPDSTPQGISDYSKRSNEIKTLAPLLHDVLANSASNRYDVRMRPFDRRRWKDELGRLNTTQLRRLRLLVAVHLAESRKSLRSLYAEMQRFRRSMKPGEYGEELSERLHEFMEEALKDIDNHLQRVRNGYDGGRPF